MIHIEKSSTLNGWGSNLERVAGKMIQMSDQYKDLVDTTFNGVLVEVIPGDTIEGILDRYRRGMTILNFRIASGV